MSCYRIENDGSLCIGIPVAHDVKPYVAVRNVRVPLVENHSNGTMPTIVDTVVTDAQPGWLRGRRPALVGSDRFNGCLLLVTAEDLHFDVRRSAKFPVHNAYPGVEQLYPAFVQAGRRKSRLQTQLVIVQHNTDVIVADTSAQYLTIRCEHGRLWSQATRRDEFAQYLVQRAMLRTHDHRGLLWTFKTLESLRMLHHWRAELRCRLERLERRRLVTT